MVLQSTIRLDFLWIKNAKISYRIYYFCCFVGDNCQNFKIFYRTVSQVEHLARKRMYWILSGLPSMHSSSNLAVNKCTEPQRHHSNGSNRVKFRRLRKNRSGVNLPKYNYICISTNNRFNNITRWNHLLSLSTNCH
jgi:hypothetical protein